MSDMCLAIIVGRLTRDAEIKVTPNGKSLLAFSVASNPGFSKEDPAVFMDVQCWGDRWSKIFDYLKKGTKIAVNGTMKSHSWTGKDGSTKTQLRLDATDVSLLDTRVSGGGDHSAGTPDGVAVANAVRAENRGSGAPQRPLPAADDFPDDIPF